MFLRISMMAGFVHAISVFAPGETLAKTMFFAHFR
jgi:hypothetical protein